MKNNLEDRLVEFAVSVIEVTKTLNSQAGIILSKQLIRSGTAGALNYGEAQSAESRKDFIHKVKVVLKEMRETYVCLRIIKEGKLSTKLDLLDPLINENNELISIFVKSVDTAQKNLRSNKH